MCSVTIVLTKIAIAVDFGEERDKKKGVFAPNPQTRRFYWLRAFFTPAQKTQLVPRHVFSHWRKKSNRFCHTSCARASATSAPNPRNAPAKTE